MRSCPLEETLSGYLAQDLNGDKAREVEAHLVDCNSCQLRLHHLTDEPLEDTWKKQQEADSSAMSQTESWVLESLSARVLRALTDAPSAATGTRGGDPGQDENSLPTLPGYELEKLLAQGGMAVIYLARQMRPSRQVAIKFISARLSEHGRPADRLFAEADALARLHHPNIVEIFEVGEHQGQPYLVLEYLAGGTLEDAVRGTPLPCLRVAALMETLAEAVEAAHRAGLVHRDLKPSNILLSPEGIPKIVDFGLVKHLSDAEGLTTAGAVLGTPSYMAPEQAGGQTGEITPATDVYALGAVLYALLTGRPPFKAVSPLETVLQVLHEEPPTPWLLRRELPADLQTICLHCLEKDPARRYASAAELAADLRRFRQGEPIAARPVGLPGRAAKWARRRPAVAGLLGTIAFLTAVSLALMTWLWERAETRAITEAAAKEVARESEQREKSARRDVERLSANLALDQAQSLCDKGDVGRGLISFVRALELAVRAEDVAMERTTRLNLAAWRRQFIGRPTVFKHPEWVYLATFSPDEKVLLTVCIDKKVRLWNVAAGKILGEPLAHDEPIIAAVFSPDGGQILTGSGRAEKPGGELRVWDAATGKLLATLPHPGAVTAIQFSPIGNTFLTACDHQAQQWTKQHTAIGLALRHDNAKVTTAAFSPDGRLIVTGGSDGIARLWDSASGKAGGKPMLHGKSIMAAAFHPNGQVLATSGEKDPTVQLWDLVTGEKIGQPLIHAGYVRALSFSPDGRQLAIGAAIHIVDPAKQRPVAAGGEVRIWQPNSGKLLGVPVPHPLPVWSLAFSPASDRLLTGCEDGIARIFMCLNGQPLGNSFDAGGTVQVVAFTKDGRTAMTASSGSSARLWNLVQLQGVGTPVTDNQTIRSLDFSPNGQVLAAGAEDGLVRLWDMGKNRFSDVSFRHGGLIRSLAWSGAGDALMTGGQDSFARLWAYPSGKLVREIGHTKEVSVVASFPSGQGFLTGQEFGGVHRWDAVGQAVGLSLETSGASVTGLAITPDGQRVWVGTLNPEVECRDLATGRVLQKFGHGGEASIVALSPDGSTILTGNGAEGRAHLWDLASAQPKGPPLVMNRRGLSAAAFSPDGRTVMIVGTEGGRLWDVATGKPIGSLLPEPRCLSCACSPDGKVVATGGKFGARLWPTSEPMTGPVESVRAEIEALTGMDSGGQ